MKVRITLVNGTSYLINLERNNILTLQQFDDVVMFTQDRVLIDIDENRIVARNVMTYKETD